MSKRQAQSNLPIWACTMLAVAMSASIAGAAVSDPQKVEGLRGDLERAKGMVVADPAAALKLVDGVLTARAGRQNDRSLGVEATWLKAQALSRIGRNQEALDVVGPAIIEARSIKVRDSLLGELIFTRAGIYRVLGNLTNATIDIQQSIQIFESANDKQGSIKSYILIASIYSNAGNYKKSKDYYDQAISLGIQDKFTKFALFNNIGGLERSEGKYVQSSDNFRKALEISRGENYPAYLELSIVTSLASIEIINKRYSIANSYINRGDQLSKSNNLNQERIFLEAVKAQLLADRGNYIAASNQFDKAFSSLDFSKTGPQFSFFHQLHLRFIFVRVGMISL